MSSCWVLGGVAEFCGQLAAGIVQVWPTAASLQALIAVLPAASLEISAPLIAVAPAASSVILIVTVSKPLRATLASVESYSSPWAASRRKIAARWVASLAAYLRVLAVRSPVSVMAPPELCGAASGCAASGRRNLKVARAGPAPAFWLLTPGASR